ncbi:DNA fragmentation factor subunit alpha isoform X1 [Gadus macrocephalus]|uniref:DNA fragmentation factor subunit alpha isoform X1 n=1 Tax=Gadus macrocephalus TaxID=80720 RepID=UPI0028CB5A2B|nr:DNA fragmentation factor subunit alpha isoform X1 [Gadus macrocephalus]
MGDMRPCKVCDFKRQHSIGVVVTSLEQLKIKGGESLPIGPDAPVKVVLEEDGTIVEDEIYFLCLPSNTKFMLLGPQQMWCPVRRIDGGTSWMNRDSMLLEVDAVDGSISQVEPWWLLAQQLKQNMSSIITMSETDLQTLVDIPCAQLTSALNFPESKVQNLQKTLQGALDHREEVRQAKELLQLYVKAVEKQDSQEAQSGLEGAGDTFAPGAGCIDQVDGMEVDSASGFMTRTLMVLKGKTSPETRLSTEELQVVLTTGAPALEEMLGWDGPRSAALLEACRAEMAARLQRVQALGYLSSLGQPPEAARRPDPEPQQRVEPDPAAGSPDTQG